MFINYNRQSGIAFSISRQADGYWGDLADVLEAIKTEGAAVCCDLDGAKDALCDGAYLAQIGAGQDEVEELYNAIVDFEKCTAE